MERSVCDPCGVREGRTSEQPAVVHRSRVHALLTHLVLVPAVEAHILLPLLEPVTVHQIPAGSDITSTHSTLTDTR